MGALKEQGLIDEEKITFWINKDDVDSTVTFGGLISNSINGDTYSLSTDKLNQSWWTVDLLGSSYGGNEFKTVQKAILDTGTSFLTIASSDYDMFEDKMLDITGVLCSRLYGYCMSSSSCSSITGKMEDMSFQLDY